MQVLKALAAYERLRRLVYLTCKAESLLTNVLELCVASGGGGTRGGEGGRGVQGRPQLGAPAVSTSQSSGCGSVSPHAALVIGHIAA